MKSIDQTVTENTMAAAEGIPVDDNDVELLTRSGIKLLNAGGIDVIKKAIDTSADPAQVIGQFMAQLILKMGEEFVQKLQVDPRAFLAKGGFLEELLDYIEGKLSLPPEFSDQVYGETVEVIKAVVQSNSAKGPGVQPQQAQPEQASLDSMAV